MTSTEPGWELYRTFLEVARDGSLSGAARKLGLTQPTAGRHIDQLEASLGVKLFSRSPLGLKPTPSALELVSHAETMAAASQALRRTASGGAREDRGTVRITASEMVGCEVLPAMLARFRDNHPGIAIELALSNRNEDLLRRDADIAVRMVRPRQKSLLARRVGKSPVGLFAHRAYAEKFGLPKTIGDLQNHCMIGFDRNAEPLKSLGPMPWPLTREIFAFRSDNDVAQFSALRCGVGIGGCQHGIARNYPELVGVLSKTVRFELDMWVVMHEDMRATPRVRRLFDHLVASLSAFLRG
ncbi:LysR family transcriptional regulator [Bradyrhizobium sp.]|uniref:LysR family transcriptional regulator n=1 Tax=Bradyrhizobium sp. TaxID=376 RepID=UPI002D4D3CFE|nr:LysR family transcriptional regulator [Bradyrhizobium sp.]HZR72704.1 LysR family transcriptional regulator [Bradyrhizobium sp.]